MWMTVLIGQGGDVYDFCSEGSLGSQVVSPFVVDVLVVVVCILVLVELAQPAYIIDNITFLKSKCEWPGNATITNCRPAHGTVRKRHRKLTATLQQENNWRKATSSLSHRDNSRIWKGIRYCIAKENPARNTHNQWAQHKQEINNRTATFKRTEATVVLYAFGQIFTLDLAVVKHKNV